MPSNPEVYFGEGASHELENIFPDHKFHLLHIPELPTEQLKKIKKYLSGRIISEHIYDSGMPDIANLKELQNDFWASQINDEKTALLAIGGGSLMDVAKVLRFKPTHSDWLEQNLNIDLSGISTPKIPLILMPTTAGTGSEVTSTATIWNFEEKTKHSFFGSDVIASVAIVDSILCLGAPWKITRDSALDALSHALEALWNKNRSDDTKFLAVMAAKNICHYLPDVHLDLHNKEARERLSEASLAAGLAMSKTQTSLVHALSYADTVNNHKSHGESCANWLPYVWQLLLDCDGHEDVKDDIASAIGAYFSTPKELRLWLLGLGVVSHDLEDRGVDISNRIEELKSTPRGKNFIGFIH